MFRRAAIPKRSPPCAGTSCAQLPPAAASRSIRREPSRTKQTASGWAAPPWTRMGNIALGMSVSGDVKDPSVWYTGRLSTRQAQQTGSAHDRRERKRHRNRRQPTLGRLLSMSIDPVRRLHLLVQPDVLQQEARREIERRLGHPDRRLQVRQLQVRATAFSPPSPWGREGLAYFVSVVLKQGVPGYRAARRR